MIRKTIFCVCLIMLLARCGYGAERKDLNGNDWQEWNRMTKATYILGFTNGSIYLVSHNLVDIILLEANKKRQFSIEETNKITKSIKQRYYSSYNISVGQIVEGIDILYKDFKNKGIRISDAIYVVKRQIEGTSPEDIEKILIYLRSNYKNVESLITRDKNGEMINFVEFP